MDKIISTLAFLYESFEPNEYDYLDTVLPLYISLINKFQYDVIEVEPIVRDFALEYGISIPHHPTITILNRLKKNGFITQKDKKYYPEKKKLLETDFQERENQIEVEYQNVMDKFIDFCRIENTILTSEESEIAFISYLKKMDLDILFISPDNQNILPDVETSTSTDYLVNKFIIYSYLHNFDLFTKISNIALGHIILSTAIFHEYQNFQGKLEGLCIYLDIGFLFSLTGINGPYRKTAFCDFINFLNENKINLNIFRHTYNEFLGIVEPCENLIGNPVYDPSKANNTLRFFMENGKSKADVAIFIAEIPQVLKSFKISIVDKPIKNEKEAFYQINEEKLTSQIINVYKDNNPYFDYDQMEPTIKLDVDSISAIYFFRKGNRPLAIKDAKYFLLTTNSTLAYISRIFNSQEFNETHFTIPCVITDIFLGTLLWAQSPTSVVNFNKKRLISFAFSAVEPNKNLKAKLVSQAKRLLHSKQINEDQATILLETQLANELLAELTLGDSNRFTDRTSFEIIEEYQKEIQTRERLKNQSLIDRVETENSALITENTDLLKKINHQKKIAKKISQISSWFVFIFLSLIFGTGIFLATGLVEISTFWRILTGVISFIVGIIGILFGTTIINIKNKLQIRLYNFIIKNIYFIE